jgi:hypothetical protein
MKKQRSIRPGVESLEHITLLSAGVVPHPAEHARPAPVAIDAARLSSHLIGYVYTGNGTVSPMGAVHGSLNTRQRTITLSNGGGSVRLKLTHVHKYPNTLTALSYKIIKATGQFRSLHGQGHSSVTAVTVGSRWSSWTASFYP